MSGFSRVSISDSLRKTIQDIKEITGKHSDEDVYAVLKECNMDPNETAQKLLYLDTFHEVKKKRDRRKVSVPNRAFEEYRQIPGMQRRGTKGGNYYSTYYSDDSAGGRQLNARQETGHRASKPSMLVVYKQKNKTPAVASSSRESSTQLADHNNRGVIKENKVDYINNSRKLPSLRIVSVNQVPTSNPGPTPAPTPTNSSTVATSVRTQGGSMKSRSPSVSGLYSSESDPVLVPSLNYPVLVPSLNPRNPGPGIIKRQTGNQRSTADINANLIADSRRKAVQNGPTGQAVLVSVDSSSNTDQRIAAAKGNQETSKEMSSEAADVAQEDPASEEETSEVDAKLHISVKQSVIFPNHLHVPEAFKNILTFGSLDAPPLGQNNEDSNPRNASVPTNVEPSKEPSPPPQSSSQTSVHGDYPDRPPSPPRGLVNLSSSQENISSDKYDQSKQEMLQPVGIPQNPLLPPMPDHSLNIVPPVVGSHLVQLEGLDPHGGNSLNPLTMGSTPSMSQPRGIAQSSMAASPELFPFLRPPYPPNYIPYSPYFSQLYMPPQNAPQLLGHSGFPQQPSAYMPPTAAAAAASGVKFPMPPPVYKPGHLTHFGISSGYASGLAPLPPGTSCNADMAGSELKEKNMYSTMKQNEDLHGLNSAPGQANIFYNLPQGQPVAFSPNSFPGIYHPNQSMSNPSLVPSTVESMVPPMSSYPQPQTTQFLPLPQHHYAQMNWNQKLLNRENM